MKKKIRDITCEEFLRWANDRVTDGHWSLELALVVLKDIKKICKACFLKSKLYNNKIKPKDLITFVKDLRGDFWEINPNQDRDKNLPEQLRATPLALIHKSYDQLVKENGS